MGAQGRSRDGFGCVRVARGAGSPCWHGLPERYIEEVIPFRKRRGEPETNGLGTPTRHPPPRCRTGASASVWAPRRRGTSE